MIGVLAFVSAFRGVRVPEQDAATVTIRLSIGPRLPLPGSAGEGGSTARGPVRCPDGRECRGSAYGAGLGGFENQNLEVGWRQRPSAG